MLRKSSVALQQIVPRLLENPTQCVDRKSFHVKLERTYSDWTIYEQSWLKLFESNWMTHRPEPRTQERNRSKKKRDEQGTKCNMDVTGPAVRISGNRGTMFWRAWLFPVHGFLIINRDYVWYACSGTACDAAEIKLGNRDRTKIASSPDTEKKIVRMALKQHPPKQQQPASWPMGSSRKQRSYETPSTRYTPTHAYVHTYIHQPHTQCYTVVYI